ncbi:MULTISPECIES: CTP synthase C-terminal region-related (seleno)protein [unclassified Pseudomonas]|uniref:CTP synthase C-terminal region-related (seleno)protein n=1 Tax=unclassified Pseudomonas TaxID=196821 RepID=UPI0025FCF0D2|nr:MULTISPECIES: CTP synthase [unclassified Pseudomonas]
MKQKQTIRIALVGDYDEGVAAHQAIPVALARAAGEAAVNVEPLWLPTPQIGDGSCLRTFDGIWCVPGSPYRDMDGALTAIRVAREGRVPFLGTCGGYQHAVLEYARNHLGWVDAEHGETAPQSPRAIITPLSCSLIEAFAPIRLLPGSQIAKAYGALQTQERYRCRYGLRKALEAEMFTGPLKVSGYDHDGEVRAIELANHPFFVATLFQPERAALDGITPPLVKAFVVACAKNGASRDD